jgi:hypothetical protein
MVLAYAIGYVDAAGLRGDPYFTEVPPAVSYTYFTGNSTTVAEANTSMTSATAVQTYDPATGEAPFYASNPAPHNSVRSRLLRYYVSNMAACTARLAGTGNSVVTACFKAQTRPVAGVGAAPRNVEPTPYAVARWRTLNIRGRANIAYPPGTPAAGAGSDPDIATPQELAAVMVFQGDEFARRFGVGRGLFHFSAIEGSGKDCFGDVLPHLHELTVITTPVDYSAFVDEVREWANDCGLVGSMTGTNPYSEFWISCKSLNFFNIVAPLLYFAKERASHNAIRLARDLLQRLAVPCNVALFSGERVGPSSAVLSIPAHVHGTPLGLHGIAFCTQWLLGPVFVGNVAAHGAPNSLARVAAEKAHYYPLFSLDNTVWLPYVNGLWGHLHDIGGVAVTSTPTAQM